VVIKTVVLGIGNTLLSDDGVGVHLLEHLRDQYPNLPGVIYLDGGTLSFGLAPWIEGAGNLILLDAAELGADPGNVRLFKGTDMDQCFGGRKQSVHEVSLCDLLAIAHLAGTLPARRALIAIQPKKLGWGMGLSRPVEQALPTAARQLVDLVMEWQSGHADIAPGNVMQPIGMPTRNMGRGSGEWSSEV
jgi:hydrogenase maturation protease